MGRIVAIGGGEIGRYGSHAETLEIDVEIKKMSGKSNPKLLFISTASKDSKSYIDSFYNHFGKRLGCSISNIELHKNNYTYNELKQMVFSSDIIYVGQGNTKMMLSLWKRVGLDRILARAFNETDIVLSGLSAGAICWFKFGISDSERFENPNAELINLPCLGLVDLTICPHYDVEEDRKPNFINLIKETGNIGIGLDDCCAIKIEGPNYRINTSNENSFAWITQWKNNKLFEVKLGDGATGSLTDLYSASINVS